MQICLAIRIKSPRSRKTDKSRAMILNVNTNYNIQDFIYPNTYHL